MEVRLIFAERGFSLGGGGGVGVKKEKEKGVMSGDMGVWLVNVITRLFTWDSQNCITGQCIHDHC